MLDHVLASEKCINYSTILYDGERKFCVDPNFLVNASDYFKSMCSFRKAGRLADKLIDLHTIWQERMIEVGEFW
jgi:hypothetical protein